MKKGLNNLLMFIITLSVTAAGIRALIYAPLFSLQMIVGLMHPVIIGYSVFWIIYRYYVITKNPTWRYNWCKNVMLNAAFYITCLALVATAGCLLDHDLLPATLMLWSLVLHMTFQFEFHYKLVLWFVLPKTRMQPRQRWNDDYISGVDPYKEDSPVQRFPSQNKNIDKP